MYPGLNCFRICIDPFSTPHNDSALPLPHPQVGGCVEGDQEGAADTKESLLLHSPGLYNLDIDLDQQAFSA